MIRYIGTDPRKSVLMPRAISLRSRVLGNWQARFWRPAERGDPSAEFNQSQGHHLTGPEVGLGVFGHVVHLLIDVVEQCRDKIGGHAALLSGEGCHADQCGRVVGRRQAQKIALVGCIVLYIFMVCTRLTPSVSSTVSPWALTRPIVCS